MKVKILYWGHGVNIAYKDKAHCHPFWQIEILKSEKLYGFADSQRFIMNENDILLLPPLTCHGFDSKKTLQSLYSFKFKLEEDDYAKRKFVLLRNCLFTREISRIADIILENQPSPGIPNSQMLPYMLESIMRFAYDKAENAPMQSPEFMEKIREAVLRYGKQINVENAAQMLNWSSGHLKFMCHKHARQSAKEFIDDICMELLKSHLRFTHLRISEIARISNFNDLYAMSRFFRRKSGISPSEFRVSPMNQQ